MRLHLPPRRVRVWTAAAVALVVVATLLWRGSDAAATRSTTADPASLPSGSPAATVSEVWSVTGVVLPDDVLSAGRVIVGSVSGVRALDPLTGRVAWQYTRANATLCGLTATDDVVVAVFRTADRCDEAVALRSGTGVRAWTRNVNFSGHATIDGTHRIVLASTPTGVATLDPIGNTLRWRYRPPAGCRIVASDVGEAGVAVLQECGGGSARTLRLIDGFDGDVHWTHDLPDAGADDVELLGADRLVGLVVGSEVQLLSRADGSLLQRLPVGEDAIGSVQLASTGTQALVRIGDTLSVLDADSGELRWTAPADGLPRASAEQKSATAPAALLLPTGDTFVRHDRVTGAETGRSVAAGLPSDGVVTGLGPVIVLRVGDRVIGFR